MNTLAKLPPVTCLPLVISGTKKKMLGRSRGRHPWVTVRPAHSGSALAQVSAGLLLFLSSRLVLPDSFVMPRTIACQAPLSIGLPRQEYCNGLPFPSPGALPDSAVKPTSPALAGGFFTTEPQWSRLVRIPDLNSSLSDSSTLGIQGWQGFVVSLGELNKLSAAAFPSAEGHINIRALLRFLSSSKDCYHCRFKKRTSQ